MEDFCRLTETETGINMFFDRIEELNSVFIVAGRFYQDIIFFLNLLLPFFLPDAGHQTVPDQLVFLYQPEQPI